MDFALKTANAHTDADFSTAADHLAKAVALLGEQTVLAILLKKRTGVLGEQFFQVPNGPADPLPLSALDHLPSNR